MSQSRLPQSFSELMFSLTKLGVMRLVNRSRPTPLSDLDRPMQITPLDLEPRIVNTRS